MTQTQTQRYIAEAEALLEKVKELIAKEYKLNERA